MLETWLVWMIGFRRGKEITTNERKILLSAVMLVSVNICIAQEAADGKLGVDVEAKAKVADNNLAFLLTRSLLMIQYSAQCELLTKKYTTFLEMAIEKSNFFLKGAIL